MVTSLSSLNGNTKNRSFNQNRQCGITVTSSIDPTTLVIKECDSLIASMRKVLRWSQTGVGAIFGAHTADIFSDEHETFASRLGLRTRNTSSEEVRNSYWFTF